MRLPQPDVLPGKLRPALVLSELPGPFGDVFVRGISSQLRHEVPRWDERLTPAEPDFTTSGLKVASVIRLTWLAAVNPSVRVGTLGTLAPERLSRLRQRLSTYLAPPSP